MITRVRDRRSFVALRTQGVRARRGPLSGTYVADDEPTGEVRLAFAITKRVGPAVVRNRLRRRLRAICGDLAADRPDLLVDGILLLSAGPEAIRRTPVELRNDVVRLLEELQDRRGTR